MIGINDDQLLSHLAFGVRPSTISAGRFQRDWESLLWEDLKIRRLGSNQYGPTFELRIEFNAVKNCMVDKWNSVTAICTSIDDHDIRSPFDEEAKTGQERTVYDAILIDPVM